MALAPPRPSSPPSSTHIRPPPQLPPPSPPIFCLSFNQDDACIACGTSSGFRIFNSDPLRETIRREFDGVGAAATAGGGRIRRPSTYAGGRGGGGGGGDGFTIVEMLFRCNLLALVSPRYSSNKVMIWDDDDGRCIGELLFRSVVRAVRLRRDRILVVLEHKIYMYNIADLRLVHQVETLANPTGLCALSPASGSCVMACPGLHRGEVRVELYSNKKTRFLQAHTSSLACLSLCLNGSLLATASTKGTLIRIFSTADGTKLQELRRGADRADIYSLAFSSNCNWLAVSSDKGTIHVFGLKEPWSSQEDARAVDGPRMSSSAYTSFQSSLSSSISSGFQLARSSLLSLANANTGSSLSFMKGVLPRYFSSEWSFAQFRLPEEARAIVAFGSQINTIVVVCSNGSYYKCSYDPIRGGEMALQESSRLINDEVEGM